MTAIAIKKWKAHNRHHDQETATTITHHFQTSPYVAVRYLECRVEGGVAVISGKVPSYYARQVAIGLAKATDGVTAIQDRIAVTSAPTNGSPNVAFGGQA